MEPSTSSRRERLRELRNQRALISPQRSRNQDLRRLSVPQRESAYAEEPSLDQLVELIGNPTLRNVLSRELAHLAAAQGGSSPEVSSAQQAEQLGLEDLEAGYRLDCSSPLSELSRYQKTLEARADWLDAALEETLMELERINETILSTPDKVKAKRAAAEEDR